jgi:hypothetical protein
MSSRRVWCGVPRLAVVTVLLLLNAPAQAGPCTREIERMQAQVDAALEQRAGAGPSARERAGALLHRQPTPGSIARAEEILGEGSGGVQAVAALARAREADRAGDRKFCEQALAEARQAIGH